MAMQVTGVDALGAARVLRVGPRGAMDVHRRVQYLQWIGSWQETQ